MTDATQTLIGDLLFPTQYEWTLLCLDCVFKNAEAMTSAS